MRIDLGRAGVDRLDRARPTVEVVQEEELVELGGLTDLIAVPVAGAIGAAELGLVAQGRVALGEARLLLVEATRDGAHVEVEGLHRLVDGGLEGGLLHVALLVQDAFGHLGAAELALVVHEDLELARVQSVAARAVDEEALDLEVGITTQLTVTGSPKADSWAGATASVASTRSARSGGRGRPGRPRAGRGGGFSSWVRGTLAHEGRGAYGGGPGVRAESGP